MALMGWLGNLRLIQGIVVPTWLGMEYWLGKDSVGEAQFGCNNNNN